MPRFPGFVGPSYTLRNLNQDNQRCQNWYPSIDESLEGKSPLGMDPSPGTVGFCSLGSGPTRGLYTEPASKRVFGVGTNGINFLEINANQTVTGRGNVTSDGRPVSWASNGSEILICSNGNVYVFVLATNGFTQVPVTMFLGPVAQVGFLDGFFIALIQNSRTFQISQLEDGANWDITDFATINQFGDHIPAFVVDHENIILFGNTKSVLYNNAGGALFPFSYIPGSLIEHGIAAVKTVVQVDDGVFWLGEDARGNGVLRRLVGLQPARVSNHGFEEAIQNRKVYPIISDAVSYAYQNLGHSMIRIYFPSALPNGATWEYDISTQMLNQPSYHDPTFGVETAHRSWVYTFGFGKHFVGDWAGPGVQEMSSEYVTDSGNNIVRLRRGVHLCKEQLRQFFRRMQIDMEVGGVEPLVSVQFADYLPGTSAARISLIDLATGLAAAYLAYVKSIHSVWQEQFWSTPSGAGDETINTLGLLTTGTLPSGTRFNSFLIASEEQKVGASDHTVTYDNAIFAPQSVVTDQGVTYTSVGNAVFNDHINPTVPGRFQQAVTWIAKSINGLVPTVTVLQQYWQAFQDTNPVAYAAALAGGDLSTLVPIYFSRIQTYTLGKGLTSFYDLLTGQHLGVVGTDTAQPPTPSATLPAEWVLQDSRISPDPMPIEPHIMIRWSDDGGRTWSNEHWLSVGASGDYKKRVILNAMGSGRDRVYEVSASDPIQWRISDAYLQYTVGRS